ncbi:E3 ubiquitin-protein ligase listerin [Nymphon striatum]|nr:E3 ubiquitin-protein ligase listerin [Nymphon striatum]
MGGNKKANRTKGNTRPSNSGRSAQLLANDGIGLQEFIGFQNQTCDKVIVPVTGAGFDDETDSIGIDGDFRLVMRKMSKKDVNTKLKAIQEFGEICKAKEIEALKAVLPFWPRIYNKLSFDPDRRVREATHVAHRALLVKVQKDVAPYLKSLMGTWFICTCDMHAPASSAAMEALESTFPENKLPNALLHCKAEIMTLIEGNLLKVSAESLSDSSVVSPEEMELKYSNIVSASMLGLSQFLELIPNNNHHQINDSVLALLSSSKFWKLGNYKNTKIRSSFFQLLSSLSKHMPNLITDHAAESCHIVFCNLNCSEPLISPYIWECALYLVVTITDWWNHVKLDKVVIPQILPFLRAKGYGSATVIYPSILPLLSRFPDDFYESEKCVYLQLLESMKESLCGKLSKSDLNAIIKAYVECLSYIVKKVFQADSESLDSKLSEFIHDYLIVLIQSSIFEKASLFHDSDLYVIVRDTISATSAHKKLLAVFWQQFNKIIVDLPVILHKTDESTCQYIFNELHSLYQNFVFPHHHKSRTKKKVIQFSLPEEVQVDLPVTSTAKAVGDADCIFINDDVMTSMELICEKILSENETNWFYSMSVIFVTKMLLLVSEKNESATKLCSISLDHFILEKLIPLIELIDQDQQEDNVESAMVEGVKLIFRALPWLSDENKNLVLFKLSKIEDKKLMESIILLAHSSKEECVKKWLNSSDILCKINVWIEEACTVGDSRSVNEKDCHFILRILKPFISGGFETVESSNLVENFLCCIFEAFKFNFMREDISSTELHLLKDVYSTFLKQYQLNKVMKISEDIALYLYQIICSQPPAVLSDGVLEVMISLCKQNILKCMDISNSNAVVIDCVKWTKKTVATIDNFENFEILISAMADIILPLLPNKNTLHFDDSKEYRNLVQSYFDDFLYSDEEWKFHDAKEICQYVLSLNVLCGNTLSSEELLTVEEQDDQMNLSFYRLLCMASYSLKLLQEFQENFFAKSIHDQSVSDRLCEVIYQVLSVSVMFTNPKYSFFRDEEQQKIAYFMDNLLATYLQGLSNDLLTHIFQYSCKQCKTKGGFSALVFEKYMQNMPPNVDLFNATLVEVVNDEELSLDDINYSQSQVFSEVLKVLCVLCERNSVRFLFEHWDFLLCNLGDWIKGLQMTNVSSLLRNSSAQLVTCSIAQLFNSVLTIVNKARKTPLPNKSNLVREWDEFFVKAFFPPFLCIFVSVAEHSNQKKMSTIIKLILTKIASVLEFYPDTIIECHSLPIKLIAEMESASPEMPDLIQSLLNHLCPLLKSSYPCVQFGAYSVLSRVFPTLAIYDSSSCSESKENEEDQKPPPLPLLNVLKATNQVMNTLLEEATIEEAFVIEPFSEAYIVTRTHFLCWALFELFFAGASAEMRPKYASYLYDSGLLSNFLLHLFKFLPNDRRALAQICLKPNFSSSSIISHPVVFHATENHTITEIQNLAYSVYYKALQCFPALIRQWWNSQDKRTYSYVEKFTSQNVSSHLSFQDIEATQMAGKNFKNMTYIVDELNNISMEITIQLPTNYPLGVIVVTSEHKGVAVNKWRRWMYQLNTFLMHQNGSIVEALNLWRGNVDQLYEGVEECYICYSIIHDTTCQIPKKTCRTCKKKFHSACLFKWFNTSSQSSCPTCRNLF